jgi:hypothetical protein
LNAIHLDAILVKFFSSEKKLVSLSRIWLIRKLTICLTLWSVRWTKMQNSIKKFLKLCSIRLTRMSRTAFILKEQRLQLLREIRLSLTR